MPGQNDALLEKRNQHVPQGPFNITSAFIKKAHGAVMVDVDGRELIDFAGGIGVNNVGHCHPKVVAAIQDQAGKFIHTCFHVAMESLFQTFGWRHRILSHGDSGRHQHQTRNNSDKKERTAVHFFTSRNLGLVVTLHHGR